MAETAAATGKATYKDLLAVPENLVAEIIFGVLETHPRPAPKHTLVSSVIGNKLGPPFHHGDNGPGGWWSLDEPELHLGEHVLVPDLAGWRRERMPELPETAWFELAPDWVCEVISPSTARLDRGPKREIYCQFKIPYLWHVDPDPRTLEAFELHDGQWLLIASLSGDEEIAVAPFAAAPFGLGALWAD